MSEMIKSDVKIEIVPLTPERTDDYLSFFENTFDGTGEWGHLCYCISWCSAPNFTEQGMEHAEVRREAAIRYIRDGVLKGYLACADGKVVAWCNANDRNLSLNCYGMRCHIFGCEMPADEKRVKSVFCFEVVPHMRGKHIASALLERVIADAKSDGYEYVEAYPLKGTNGVQENFYGHRAFYEKNGFEPFGETENNLVVRKKL